MLFEGLYQPLGASVFSVLAFFITTAAYRAFEFVPAKPLMMGAAFIVMMAQVPMGMMLTNWLPETGGAANLPHRAGEQLADDHPQHGGFARRRLWDRHWRAGNVASHLAQPGERHLLWKGLVGHGRDSRRACHLPSPAEPDHLRPLAGLMVLFLLFELRLPSSWARSRGAVRDRGEAAGG